VGSQRTGSEHQTCPPRHIHVPGNRRLTMTALIRIPAPSDRRQHRQKSRGQQRGRASYIIVDTRPLDLRQEVMLPAGVISSVDHENTTSARQTAPKTGSRHHRSRREHYRDDSNRTEVGSYYALAASVGKTGSRSFVVVGGNSERPPELNTASGSAAPKPRGLNFRPNLRPSQSY